LGEKRKKKMMIGNLIHRDVYFFEKRLHLIISLIFLDKCFTEEKYYYPYFSYLKESFPK